jgi:sugar O-acyltransferase (sialic acid O-acetyltransferase NeuD family)
MVERRRLVIVGAGGQARETRWIADEMTAAGHARFELVGCVVSNPGALTDRDSREWVLGDLAWLSENKSRFDALALGIGTPAARLRLAAELEKRFPPQWWPALIHPTAVRDSSTCRIAHGVLIAPGVTAMVNVELGAHSLANSNVTLGHEAWIGRGSVINPGANISGGVRIGEGVLIGTGAQVLQYRTIGERAVVGAGAVVTRDVRPGETVVGVPARSRPAGAGKKEVEE